MIIAVGGKRGSGKGAVAEYLMAKGYSKISFADKLKDLTCYLYGWDRSRMGELDYKEELLEKPVVWTWGHGRKAERFLGLEEGSLERHYKEFASRRVALQYIGTEILRAYDPNFHVNTVKQVVGAGNYVMDDTRYPNELEALSEMGALSLYIVRPNQTLEDDKALHISETSLSEKDFDYVVVNNGTLEDLYQNVETLISLRSASAASI